MSPAEIPEDYRGLFDRKSFATFATLMPHGAPHLTVVWIDFDGEYVVVNAARGRRKVDNVERDPTVAALVIDPDDPYRYIAIRGEVVEVTEDGAVDHYNELGRRYTGAENRYQERHGNDGPVRVILRIRPDAVTAWSIDD